MNFLDWLIVGAFLALSLGVGVAFTRRAGRSIKEYFLSGRNLSWWLLGTSMVATTFAADTPLAVTEYVRSQGIWGNWFWWTLAIGHVLAALVFSRLWRRAGVLTDNELIELRYSGQAAAFLRAFKALYFATVYNFIVMGWVTAAMSTVFSAFLGIPITAAVLLSMVVAVIYSILAGLWGVAVTDLLQFILAMAGCVLFAVLAAERAGGMPAMLTAIRESGRAELLSFFPASGADSTVWLTFAVYLLILWWSNHGADGGGYIIQRMMSAKNETHALLGTCWFALAHYVLRVWPWVVVALASLVLLPQLVSQPEKVSDREAYPALMNAILPAGLRGVFVATFLSAYMSTIVTHINWGASYLVNDVYKRFLKPKASEGHYLIVSRLLSLLNMVIGGLVALFINRITAAWELVWALGAGVGGVLILRWFWYRINAWSEITAMAASLIITAAIYVRDLLTGGSTPLWLKAFIVVGGSTVAWLTVSLLSQPEPEPVLRHFCERVRPGGIWPFAVPGGIGKRVLLAWAGGVALLYGSMFLLGSLILGSCSNFVWEIPLVVIGAGLLRLGLKDAFTGTELPGAPEEENGRKE